MSKRKSPREEMTKETQNSQPVDVLLNTVVQLHSQMHCYKKSKQKVVENILSNFFLITGHEG